MGSPFHTVRSDHTGALRMPDWLRDQYVEHHAGRIDTVQLQAAQAHAVEEVIRQQERIGLPVVTDGEFLRLPVFSRASVARYRASTPNHMFRGVVRRVTKLTRHLSRRTASRPESVVRAPRSTTGCRSSAG